MTRNVRSRTKPRAVRALAGRLVYTSRVMRTVGSILLVLLVLAQSSFSAAAAYCGHESVAGSSQHFGHHDHQHSGAGAGDVPNGPADLDPDCGFCHLGFLKTISQERAHVVPLPASALTPAFRPMPLALVPDLPVRPPIAPAL